MYTQFLWDINSDQEKMLNAWLKGSENVELNKYLYCGVFISYFMRSVY